MCVDGSVGGVFLAVVMGLVMGVACLSFYDFVMGVVWVGSMCFRGLVMGVTLEGVFLQ